MTDKSESKDERCSLCKRRIARTKCDQCGWVHVEAQLTPYDHTTTPAPQPEQEFCSEQEVSVTDGGVLVSQGTCGRPTPCPKHTVKPAPPINFDTLGSAMEDDMESPTPAEERAASTNQSGDPLSADAQMHRALGALYLELDESIARDVERKVMARYIELKTEIAELRKQSTAQQPRASEERRHLVQTDDFTFADLRRANLARLPEFKDRQGRICHKQIPGQPVGFDWALSQWANAVTGELGEAANIIKKIERGDGTLDEFRVQLAAELADVQTYLDLLAHRAGVNLGGATITKWNAVSERVGSKLRIGQFIRPPASPPAEPREDANARPIEESRIEYLRRMIEEQYDDHPTGCGSSFGERGVSLATLGALIADHCGRLEPLPVVRHAAVEESAPRPPASSKQEAAEHPTKLSCADCNLPYGEPPCSPDSDLTAEQWEMIQVRPGGGGVLCPNCIFKRASRLPNIDCIALRFIFNGDEATVPAAGTSLETLARNAAEHINRAMLAECWSVDALKGCAGIIASEHVPLYEELESLRALMDNFQGVLDEERRLASEQIRVLQRQIAEQDADVAHSLATAGKLLMERDSELSIARSANANYANELAKVQDDLRRMDAHFSDLETKASAQHEAAEQSGITTKPIASSPSSSVTLRRRE